MHPALPSSTRMLGHPRGRAAAVLLEDEDVQAHSHILAVNYLGVYHVVKACLPHMLAARRGHVLFIGSLMAMYGGRRSSPCCRCAALCGPERAPGQGRSPAARTARPRLPSGALRTRCGSRCAAEVASCALRGAAVTAPAPCSCWGQAWACPSPCQASWTPPSRTRGRTTPGRWVQACWQQLLEPPGGGADTGVVLGSPSWPS